MVRTALSAGQKHKLCQKYLLDHPEVILEALFNGHHGEYTAIVWKEYPTQEFARREQSPKLDIVAEVTGKNYREV